MVIKGILISSIAVFENHIANGGEKLLGNASSIKRRPDGKVYVSGQMQRHVLFSAIDRLNQDDSGRGSTFISNGDGVSNQIENDIRADLGGFMHPSQGDYSGRRTAPLSVTPAVALEESQIGRDLLVRLKMDQNVGSKDQALATKEYSEKDLMLMNFHLDISSVGISKSFNYENQFHIQSNFHKHINDVERMRRVKLFIEATRSMNDYASQARNAVSGEPQQVLIVFDEKLSRKASRYFTANEAERENILNELKDRQAVYFLGDDSHEGKSVNQAYKEAFDFLNNPENPLYNPAGGDDTIQRFEEVFGSNSKSDNNSDENKE